MQISRNKGATKKAFSKMVDESFFLSFFFFINLLPKRPFLHQNSGTTKKQIISHQSVINVLVYGKCLVMNIRSMTKENV